jgi:hypothetical protein
VAKTDILIVLKDKASAGIKRLGGVVKNTAFNVTSLSNAGAVALGAMTALGAGLAGTIKAASDVAEAASKFNVVFADTAGLVTVKLGEFANQTGQNINMLKEYAAALGDTFKPLGFSEKGAAELSVQLVQLATDLSSFNNIPFAETLERIQSGVVGNVENFRSFGVVVNESVINAELAAQGWDKLTGAQLEQAKAQARVNLLIKGTTDAQGDAIRTAGEFANQTRALGNDLTKLAEDVGAKWLPLATEVIGGTREAIEQLSPSVIELSGSVAHLAESLGVAGESGKSFAQSLSESITGLAGSTEALAGTIDNFNILRDILRETSKETDKTTESVKRNIGVVDALQDMTVASWVSLIKLVKGEEEVADATKTVTKRIADANAQLRMQEEAVSADTILLRKYTTEIDNASEALSGFNVEVEAARLTGLAEVFGVKPEQLDPISKARKLSDFFADVEDKKEAAKEAEEAGREAAKAYQSGLEEQFQEVRGLTSQVLGEAFGVLGDLGLEFLNEDTGRAVAEDARRLAAIAAGDFSGEAAKLLEQSNPELFRRVMAAEDPALVAQGILQDFNRGIDEFGLIDREVAKERIRRLFLGGQAQDQLIQELTSEVAQELGVGVTQVQAAIAGEFGQAATGIGAGLPGEQEIEQAKNIKTEIDKIGEAGIETGTLLSEGFMEPIEFIEGLNIKLMESLAILESIQVASLQSTENITGMGSALGLPTTATAPGPQMANGGSFVVPPQFTNDSMSINVNAGELVNVQTPSQMSSGQTINLVVDGQVLASVVSQHQGQQLAQSQVQGNNVPFI